MLRMLVGAQRLVALTLGLVLAVAPVAAQSPPSAVVLPPKEVGQIINVALQAVLSPETELSRIPVAERGVYFDFERTMEAFGLGGRSLEFPSLGLTRAVTVVSGQLIADCDQGGSGPCSGMGRVVYVQLRPISLTRTEGVVSLNVYWAVRGSRRTYLTGFATQVHLARTFTRTRTGSWRFVRTGQTAVM